MTALSHYRPELGNLRELPAADDDRLVVDVLRERCGVGRNLDDVMAIGAITRHRGSSPWNDRLCVAPAGPPRRRCLHESEWLCPLCGEGDDECPCGGAK